MEGEMAKAFDVNEKPKSKSQQVRGQQKKPQGKSVRVNENTVEEQEPSSGAQPRRPPSQS
jgi:hypothetical protein